ncbi:MAG TPA: DegT/DnrJ/EryC1/StrS family aminotransferase [Chitinophagaceae bacterium]|nr:DegT/DnrJ/EryC1/StrS family aminotransferase [Chitinophagaceae bacterium]
MPSKIWLSAPHMEGCEQAFIQEAFESNWIAPLGPNVDGFENDISRFLGEPMQVAALSSGTAAIHLALIILGVKKDDEVICQSMTFVASANPIVYQGARPVFVDSEADTWNMCPDMLAVAIKDRIAHGKKPKAIIVVHLYGMPAKMDEILALAAYYDIPVIEDAAEALGSVYKGRPAGSMGDIGIFSFNGNKIITTSGGGALVSAKPEYISQARFLATQALDKATHYQHSQTGYNYRMSNICAGIGRGQMRVLKQRVLQRRANFNFYSEAFSGIPGISLNEAPDKTFYSNHWLTVLRVQHECFTRNDLLLALNNENIDCRPAWKPMHLQPLFASARYFGTGVSDSIFRQAICLPSGSALTDIEKHRVVDCVNHVVAAALA